MLPWSFRTLCNDYHALHMTHSEAKGRFICAGASGCNQLFSPPAPIMYLAAAPELQALEHAFGGNARPTMYE